MSGAPTTPASSGLTNRIDQRFCELNGEPALVLYVTAGHPDREASWAVTPEVAEVADIIEIGIPFSDPVADGPIIQESTQAALRGGTTMSDCLELASHTRSRSKTPIVFLTYYNPVIHRGLERFARDSREAGVDGVVCPDLPAEEAAPLHEFLAAQGIHFIPMIAPTSTSERIRLLCRYAGGFVYCVSRTGVTGVRDSLNHELPSLLARVRNHTKLPRAVGFGVSKPEHARSIARLAEGVIIGSALVDLISSSQADEVTARMRAFVASIREGMTAHG